MQRTRPFKTKHSRNPSRLFCGHWQTEPRFTGGRKAQYDLILTSYIRRDLSKESHILGFGANVDLGCTTHTSTAVREWRSRATQAKGVSRCF